jgi:hypothetical protein
VTHNRNRAMGAWNAGTISTAELEHWDQAISWSIDGENGGSCAPNSPITIGGSGLAVAADFVVTAAGTMLVQSQAQFQDLVSVSGDLYVGGSTTLDDLTVGSAAVFQSTVQFNGALDVNAAAVFGSTAVFGGGVQVNGVLGLAAGAIVAGGITTDALVVTANTGVNTMSVGGAMTLTGAGHIRIRVADGVNDDHTYSVSQYDYVKNLTTLTATRNYFIDNVGAGEGSCIWFENTSNVYSTLIKRTSDGATLMALRRDVAYAEAAQFVFHNGEWRVGIKIASQG